MRLLAVAGGKKMGATLFVFFDPFSCKAAVADFGENLAHFFARFLGDDSRSGGIVALFGGVAHGIAHVAEATTVNEVDDEFEFVHALEVGHFGLIAGLNQSVESRLDELADAAAEDGLLAEEVGFGFFREGGLEHAGAGAA